MLSCGPLSVTQAVCRVAFMMTSLLGVAAMVLIWLFYPKVYSYQSALSDSHYFYRTQRVGVLPDTSVPWRGNSLLQEYAIPFGGRTWDFGGGYMSVRTNTVPHSSAACSSWLRSEDQISLRPRNTDCRDRILILLHVCRGAT